MNTSPGKKGPGQPPTTFSEAQRIRIAELAGYGIPHKEIGRIIGVDAKTLRKHCRYELKTGAVEATCAVARTLHGLATGGNVAACIFWMKARAGWSERVEVTGKDGKDLIPKLDLSDRVELGRRLAFTLAEAAHNMPAKEPEATS
jgi:hypothetical protein